MRLLLISILSVLLFFPTYWVLYPVLGPDWGAGIALFMMAIGFPVAFLRKWKRSTSRFIQACNYVLAMLVLVVLLAVAYSVVFEGLPVGSGFGLLLLYAFYGYEAAYFIRHGYMRYQAEEVAAESRQDEAK